LVAIGALLPPISTSADTALEHALALVLRHRDARVARLPVREGAADTPQRLDGSWVPVRWGQAVTNRHRRAMPVGTVDRTYLELCVLSGVVMERKSGDLCIEGSAPFSDYRAQWVSWAAYVQDAPRSCAQGGIASAPAQCVQPLHTWLAATIRTTDAMFSTHTARSITGGAPVLRRLATQPAPEGFAVIDQLLRERMPEYTIVEIRTDTEHWLNWTAAFGPWSGFAARRLAPRPRYVPTTFCYGCSLGPP
jgi:hypothetical protein